MLRRLLLAVALTLGIGGGLIGSSTVEAAPCGNAYGIDGGRGWSATCSQGYQIRALCKRSGAPDVVRSSSYASFSGQRLYVTCAVLSGYRLHSVSYTF
jgi:hypothetical protein